MINKLKRWLDSFEDDSAEKQEISIELAAAALLVEVMGADYNWDDREQDTIANILKTTLGLDNSTVESLIQDAKQHHETAHDLHTLSSRINQQYNAAEKYQLIVNLWQVAYADGNIDPYEDHRIRKISELLYVPHSEFIRAKLSAKEMS